MTTKQGKLFPAVGFIRPTPNNGRLLSLSGGTGGIAKFINLYRHQKKPYAHSPMLAPVIILTDNDDGAECVFKAAKNNYKVSIDLRNSAPFFHLGENLYLVKTPVAPTTKGDSAIEDLFSATTLATKIDGKSFDKDKLHGDHSTYGKIIFAEKVVRPNAAKIDFSGFTSTLQNIAAAKTHYKTLSAAPVSTAAAASP